MVESANPQQLFPPKQCLPQTIENASPAKAGEAFFILRKSSAPSPHSAESPHRHLEELGRHHPSKKVRLQPNQRADQNRKHKTVDEN